MPSNPNQNLVSLDIAAADLAGIDAAFTTLESKFLPHLVSLTPEQRSRLSKMGTREQLVREIVLGAAQNAAAVPSGIGTAAAEADLASLDKYRPYFARAAKIAEAANDTEMAIGIDLWNYALRVYGILKVSAPDNLKALIDKIGAFFTGGRRGTHTAAPAKTS